MAEESEIVFLRTYKNFIYTFNLLERNMAYFLHHCLKGKCKAGGGNIWLKVTFDQKSKKIQKIAKGIVSETIYDNFSGKIEKCRHMRNAIVHGNWEWKSFLSSPIHYHAPEPFNEKGSLNVEEFKDQLRYLEGTVELFRDLRAIIEKGLLKNSQHIAGADG